ncbi:hypothetical protein E2562_009017 [Oryza meyeriana var. granulata]|uniref:Hcy-binding domain-containing protein n=1 Tax=Oryza meyeriana var. granulata TaxID=110450 RepID=A0A6G1D0N3_9ORYZ|nr:hypothetical protein E2562_009017 [Oryza meyeriana var. granulata]
MGRGGDVDAAGAMRLFVREAGGCAVVDGGLATELEAHGSDLQDELSSARCLVSALEPHPQGAFGLHGGWRQHHNLGVLPCATRIVSCVSRTQATIQSSRQGACRGSWSKGPTPRAGATAPRGAGPCSWPPPSAATAPISPTAPEYTGDYGRSVTKEALKSFHRRRFQVLADAGPDLITFVTIPNKLKAQAYAELLEENDIRIPAWFSFTSKDGANAASGEPITECAAVTDCTAPRLIHGLILSIRKESGGGASETDFVSCVGKWRQGGAALVGGCCRTSPDTVRAISRALRESDDAAGEVDDDDDFPAVAVL